MSVICACVSEFVFGVFLFFLVSFSFMSDSTGLLELITPPAPDLRSLGRRAGGTATCTYKSLNNTQSPCCFTFHSSDSLVRYNLGVHTVAPEEPVGTIWSILLLSRVIMQVLPFYDYYELFTLNYKECL